MKIIKNLALEASDGRLFLLDCYYPAVTAPNLGWPVLVFLHGFKGFKDWGHWDLIAKTFVENGFAFIKFNFAYNGVSIDNPLDFVDLEAFGQNNFTKELDNLQTVLNWLAQEAQLPLQKEQLTLIGHSRGGPIAILTAAKDDRIAKVISWASVAELDYSWADAAVKSEWQSKGVRFIANARTQQQMPLYYQLVEDFDQHAREYSVKNALKNLSKPLLIVHGTADPAVPVQAAEALHQHSKHAELVLIEGADHVFGGRHPFLEEEALPKHSQELVEASLVFLK